MASALPFGISALGGILGGIGGTKKQTSTYSSSGTQEGVLQGKQNKVNKLLGQRLIDWLKLGPQVSQSDRDTLRGQVNQDTDLAKKRLEADQTARGFGNSQKLTGSMTDLETGRLKGYQSGEAGLRQEAMQRFLSAMGLGLSYDQPRMFTSSQQGQSTSPGMNPFSAAGQGFGDLSSLMYMRQMGGQPMFCWIAEELYGKMDWRALLAYWLICCKASDSFAWWVTALSYRRFGKLGAALVRRSTFVRVIAQKCFDRLLAEAMT